MFTDKEKVQCVLWFAQTKLLMGVHRKFRKEFRRKPQRVNNIHHWFKQFKETRSVGERRSCGKPAVTEAQI
jgi:hypothetical protein